MEGFEVEIYEKEQDEPLFEIQGKLKITHVEEWVTDWSNEQDKRNELEKLKFDMKMAIFERCGIDLDKIEIELEFVS